MIGFGRIREYIKKFDTQQLYRAIGIVFGSVLLLISFMLYSYYSEIQQLERKFRRLNQQRDQARTILEKHAKVLQQRTKVDDILSKDKNFKIMQYFTNIEQRLQLTSLRTREPEISSEEVVDGYTEIKLTVTLTGLNMKQVADLLYALEQNERVFIKELTLTKVPGAPLVDATIGIATFEVTTTAEE